VRFAISSNSWAVLTRRRTGSCRACCSCSRALRSRLRRLDFFDIGLLLDQVLQIQLRLGLAIRGILRLASCIRNSQDRSRSSKPHWQRLDWSAAKTPAKKKVPFGQVEPFIYKGEKYTNLAADEKHFTPNDLAEAWGVSPETIRLTFRNEPGVLRLQQPTKGKRAYVLLGIPSSVAERVHKRLSAVPQ
jgi:hypothetical protein